MLQDPNESQQPEGISAFPVTQDSFAIPASQLATETPPRELPVQRLIITRMVLKNFKSYAGVQTIGPFHKSFSSIVGPNGSGKSNVIDSLLFVFGFNARKIRQAKLSHLIHSSQEHPNLDSCSVEVHFCEILDLPGPDAYETVPNSEIIVSRAAFRNDSSRYYINGRTTTAKEVKALLKSKGIDLDHNRFLILQGEVESISQMKPKGLTEHDEGLLEYLEDIIGTSQYKEPISEVGRELEELTTDRTGKLNRVKIAERERDSLVARKDEAEEYIQNENNLVIKQSLLLQRRMLDNGTRLAKSEAQYSALKTQIDHERAKSADSKDQLATLENNYRLSLREYEAVRTQAEALGRDLKKMEREDVQLQESRKFLNAKTKKVDKAIQKDTLSLKELENTIQNAHNDTERGQQEITDMEGQLEQEEQVLGEITESLKGKTEVFSQQIEQLQNERAPWVEKIQAEQSLLDIAQSELNLLEENAQANAKQIQQAETEIEEIDSLKTQKTEAIRKAEKELTKKRGELEELSQGIQATDGQEAEFRADSLRARQKWEEAKANLENMQSRGKILQGLLRMKETGRIEGIHHRLGSLGVIDDQYDVAISTACPSLDNIVVADVPAAQKCIEHLRKNNLGRAVFVVLKQLTARPTPTPDTPEGVPRLFDLIQPKDPRYAPAFYNALRDTLVAQDMDQANRIAFGSGKRRWRVVTLSGQLIETSGAMSGGGTRVARGLMSSKFVADDVTSEGVQALERKWMAIETEWKSFMNLRRDMTTECQMIEKNLPDLETQHSKLQLEAGALEQQQATLRARLEAAHRDTSKQRPDQHVLARMTALRDQIATHTTRLAELRAQQATLDGNIKELQNKILQVGGVQLRVQKAKVVSLKERVETCQDQLVKLDVAAKKAQKDHTKLAANITKQERELIEAQQQLTQLDTDIRQKTQAALLLKERSDALGHDLEDKKDALDQTKAELDEKTEEYNGMRSAELELKHTLETAEREHAEFIKRQRVLQFELSKLSLQHVDTGDSDEPAPQLETYPPEFLSALDVAQLNIETQQLQAKLEGSKPNLSVIAEYKQRHKELQLRSQDLDDITERRELAKQKYDELCKLRLDQFMEGFNTISYKLKEMYQMITLGGNAELELVDSLDPFSEGIIFSVMPPKKSWRNIANLSGGEKTLSSLALVFALHHFKPTPLYVMDEIDAALDFRNVSIVANYIKDRTKNAQFVIISLRNNMFELADRLIGIYKTHNQTKSIAINPNAAAQLTTTIRPDPNYQAS
ncbi:Structural maintenance of chromosomes protein 4 [Dimargaris cristalligena]|uniref:Structural maintenance of chromosomes protein n=1 Tax=Dimargaris cristalligena TaxID=215637 RepID=A0A4Q0A0P9_9FUNG|nr:Structural maintenance of chromosomes protein 4 [Dimargaris cristalligena]RKP39574.1 RecF/RecN/SMC [Dimargaris cristalligena]|eukprot:RKP39574.1 RecF/RecN/SMC [Dimargaris cristalligena]